MEETVQEAYPYLSGKVKDVMTRDPLVVLEDESLPRLIDVFVRSKFHGLPVVNKDYALVGVVRDTELMSIFAKRDPSSVRYKTVQDVMRTPPLIISPDETIQRAVIKMFADDTRFLVVVDKEKNIMGVVTRLDLIKGIKWKEEQVADETKKSR